MIFGKGFQMSSNVPHYKIGIDKNRERNVQSWVRERVWISSKMCSMRYRARTRARNSS